MLIEMINGGVVDISTDTESYCGCETCDWGSSYVNEMYVYLTGGVVYVEVSQMYEYPLSDGFLMKLFLNNVDKIKVMTEAEFIEWLRKEIEAEVGEIDEFDVRGDF